ncbi:MAG: DUF2961 domain-containing protein [Pirellulales bacterium]|nr:DUF2961 domain-containing protein [Pirellulales bacterium]
MVRCFLATVLVGLLAGSLSAQSLLEGLARPLEGRSMRESSAARRGGDPNAMPLGDDTEASNHDNRHIRPGDTLVVFDAKGPGAITHLWFTFGWPGGRRPVADHQEMLLRIYWDGRERPGVEAPLGDFFANCFGRRRPVTSLPVVVESGDSYNCYWHMPFRRSARIEIVNQSRRPVVGLYYHVDWVKKESLPKDTPYFHAQYRQEYPTRNGRDYVILDTKGKGHYVGTVLAIRTRSPLWYGEGDEKIYIDGEKQPSIWGTGTEEFFGCAYGLESASTPQFGVPLFDQFEVVGAKTAAYRWYLSDPIIFNKSIRVTLEHKSWVSRDENPDYRKMSCNEREDDYATVAFWYQTGEPTFAARAPDAAARRLPSLDRVVIEAKDFADTKHRAPGETSIQSVPWLHERPQLFYRPADRKNAWIEIPFEVRRKEPLRLLINATRAGDCGVWQASLDGVKLLGPMDFYSPEPDEHEFHLLDFWPEPGRYTLRLECVGKSARSDGYGLAVESVRLRERRPRVERYGHEKDNDWRRRPIFHTKE